MRRSTAVRAAAVTVLAAGVAAPLVRRRLRLKPPVVLGAAAAAPMALCVLVPRSRARDIGTCLLQMWAYVAAYKMPYDDPEALGRRVKIAYPVKADRFLGGGVTPTLRLQRALGTPGSFKAWEKLLVWSHWFWFAFPHGTVLYLIFRHPERFQSGAVPHLRDVRHRAARLLGRADRAALVRVGRGLHGRRAHARSCGA